MGGEDLRVAGRGSSMRSEQLLAVDVLEEVDDDRSSVLKVVVVVAVVVFFLPPSSFLLFVLLQLFWGQTLTHLGVLHP